MSKKPENNVEQEAAVAQEDVVEQAPALEQKPKKVKIKLPLTRSEKDDVMVALNGKTYLIKRGCEVEVPYGVAKILERKEKMLQVAMEFEAQAAEGLSGLEKN